jgi:hypothetical protein
MARALLGNGRVNTRDTRSQQWNNEVMQPQTSTGAQLLLGALSPGAKRQRREADHSPPTSAEVKKMWIYLYKHEWCSA